MKKFYSQILMLLCLGLQSSLAQVSLNPPFVTQNDTVEIIFDATQGNAALTGVSQVYIHTGVITNLSATPTSWRHVQGNWGTADPKVAMTNLGNNLHSIKYHINSFYNVPPNETVLELAFVFRNADGSIVGRASGGGDIFVPISQAGFQLSFSNPSSDFGIYNINDTLDLLAQSSSAADLSLYHEQTLLAQETDTSQISFRLPLSVYGYGRFDVIVEADDSGTVHYDTISYLARAGSNTGVDTANYEEGITILSDSSIALKLRAPYKNFVYVIGDFNNWEVQPDYQMYREPSDPFFWIVIDGLDPNREYAFQYYIDQEGLRVADAYSTKILDPWNDQYIPSNLYPNLKSYPTGKTNFPVSVVQTKETPYQWAVTNFEKPTPEELVIYELLIRDFDSRHSYQSVIDRLAYLDSLGINAIQLMPVMEFEGNESWGYNPMFFMAADKYYGTERDLKVLVDSCHARGMAVILDIAMNHAFGQHPFVRMYFDPTAGQYGEPTAQNPWFNQQPRHDFNVGYDFDHSSNATEYYTKRVFQYWVDEFNVDGYRVDLSKGFTQKNTLGNVGAWGQYDQARINTLSRIKNEVHEIDSTAYMILEHFADNTEEKELSSRGFMLWGNINHEYNEATMGYPSNLSSAHHSNRGWGEPHLVSYMESHDEERLMYKNLKYGNSGASYSTKDTAIALDRMAQAAAFFFTIPGPKMMWQFGEMGYDYPINYCPDGTIDPGCRIANKPIRWDYMNNPDRRDLFMSYANVLDLRELFPNVFIYGQYTASLHGKVKNIELDAQDSAAVILGNFDVKDQRVSANFPHSGTWYDYTTGDSLQINGSYDTTYAPGEYHIFLDFEAERKYKVSVEEKLMPESGTLVSLFPNPGVNPMLTLLLDEPAPVQLLLTDLRGSVLLRKNWSRVGKAEFAHSLQDMGAGDLPPGTYLISLTVKGKLYSLKWHKPW